MYNAATAKVIDLTPYLRRRTREARRLRLLERTALLSQYAAAGALALYGLLRLLLCPGTPPGCYAGPLAVLWPLAWLLLLVSYVTDAWLCRRETEGLTFPQKLG